MSAHSAARGALATTVAGIPFQNPVLMAAGTAAASQTEVFRRNPRVLRGKNLFYSSAVGTDPLMTDVILDQATEAAARAEERVGELEGVEEVHVVVGGASGCPQCD